ncbi:LOW QUALITY PROTEIN: serine/threonine-protein kinase ATM [Salvia miltiorrhiza]|uniref:LOW QUALITY PROTEIN: serine/threonine-protein kinase ATM n=1 Tax=Salvia miltiorrhiza TaxID=226208 RepID=UPI0025AD99DA|nr:LOW QUALITY PROTEIN: serine/threonine-protein kinase ATM [Salvia miltiorrhiza]
MVVTGHYVDSNWNLQKRTLNFCDIPPPHTGVVISDVLQRCFREWGIEEKVWTITVDNASNNDVAVRILKENLLFRHTLPLGGQIFHVRCCAHILNLLVKDGLSSIQDVISKVRESVKYVAASEARVIMFGEIAKQLELSSKKLVLDCVTRWNATYFMLSCALEFKAVFPRYQQRDPSYTTLPSDEEWEKVRIVCSFLEDFHEITELISGSEYPTANLFLVKLVHIKSLLTYESLDKDSGTTATFMEKMLEKMKLKFDKYWGSCNLLISIAAVLDPRNKMKYIEWCADNCYSGVEGIELKVTVFETLRNLYAEYVEAYRVSTSTTNIVRNASDAQTGSSSNVSGVSSVKSSTSRSQSKYESFRKTVTSVDQMKSDFDLYFEEAVEEWNEPTQFDAIGWWKMHRMKYKILSKMACDVLSIPITTVASESALLISIFHASKESTEYIHSNIVKLQIFYHLGMAWDLRWGSSSGNFDSSSDKVKLLPEPKVPFITQLQGLHKNWKCVLKQTDLHMNLLEPFIAFRTVLLRVLNSMDSIVHHLRESAAILRKGSRISQAAAALHEFMCLCSGMGEEYSNLYWLGRLEEAKLLRAQGKHELAINLADYISQNHQLNEEAADVFRLVGKWLAETRSSNSRTVLEKYLKHAVNLAEDYESADKLSIEKRNQMHFHLAHYADALFRSHEERLGSNEWQVALRLRKHKKKELEALIKRFRSAAKGDKTDYTLKIQELQKQLAMDREEEVKLQEDRDNFLSTALEGYKRCLIIGEKYDVRVVFRLVSLWFSLSNRQIVVDSMLSTIKEVQSYKFVLLVYQIASRIGGTKDSPGPTSFQFALLSLVKKISIDHPYHTIFQLLALANGDRIKDKQRSRNSFVVDVDKKIAAEDLLKELSSYHGATIIQMKQMVEIYIKLAEMETKREDANKRVPLPRELRSVRELVRVPVVTSNIPVDRTCQYPEGFFPHFRGLMDSVTVMNGINAPKRVECLGSDGNRYRQLAKSGNDDLRQDAVMEQFFGLVNTFLQNNRDTWRRRLRIRTYKVVPFTPSAGVLEWVDGTFPLGDYLVGSSRNGGAHGCYGAGDWTFMECRQRMTTETNKRKAFQEVCNNFRPVMHYFFLERFSHPADWFEKRLAYTRSVAASSMVGYIVGLGDRHSSNILIDQATAEVVHIDLGVAFEQGLMLKTPERVPFRLTRDIIDGMGVTGVEGVFRRCCEETLSVMRTNKEALLTIIEVFIHDPLYKWALSPLKAMQRQKDIDDNLDDSLEDSEEDAYEGNKDAARALLRVKQKLDGYEDGEMRSVHGQVQQLVQDAIDPDRLCHMFPGWAAWL